MAESKDSSAAIQHPHAADRKTFEVGFFAWVEVEAFDESEAGMVAEAALGWPGSWASREPVEGEGELNGYVVQAKITRTQAMTARPLQNGRKSATDG